MVTAYVGRIRQGKIEIDSPLTLPEGSQVYITLSPLINEVTACRKANVWLMTNVGNVGTKKYGELIEIDTRPVWRFEAFITGPGIEPIGPIGHIDVEANTGQLLSTQQTAEELIERSVQLAPLS